VTAVLPTGHPFALPHKRFVHPTIDRKCHDYLGEDVGYRKATEHQGRPVIYDQPPTGGETSAALAPSTLWRWLSWLGGLKNTTRAACQVIRQKEPSAALHRQAWAVSPSKHRSEARQEVLEQALELLVVQRLFERLFSKSIFPHFATGCRWS